MLNYLRENRLPVDLTGLQTAFAALKDKLELQESAEDQARRSGAQAVVLHDLGGREPGYPTSDPPIARSVRRADLTPLDSI